ncbi:uncharacterized protein LOC111622914 [Centruroides sculpturatus]|uniref:uncharacterized protein LOC111622914 n=1 Tax=Centruroides sculpturatus TaxID=218467 RepID=UPI000C6E707A|nr:uncharacterized protein LOC111622914 [Centruroides sculpturatus]
MDTFLKNANAIYEEVVQYTSDNPKGRFGTGNHTQYILDQFARVIALAEASLAANDYAKSIDNKLSRMITKEDLTEVSTNESIINAQKEIIDKLQKIESRPRANVNVPSYSDIVKSDRSADYHRKSAKQNNTNEVILVYGRERESMTSDTVRKTIQKKLRPSTMRVGIDRLRKVAGGGIAIELSNNGDAALMEKYIAEAVPKLITKRPKKRWPHITIYSVNSDITKEDLGSLVFQQNENIGELMNEEEFRQQFRVKFVIGKRGLAYQNWVVEVSPGIRKTLIHQAKINIEWSRCRIADFCPILQCFKCTEYNHAAKDCPKQEPTCSHCSEHHLYKECPNRDRDPVCHNCKREKNSNHKHNARDPSCPMYTRIKNNIIARTDYGSD